MSLAVFCRSLIFQYIESYRYLFLQAKEVEFKYVLDEYVSSRRQHLVRLFLDALTVGGPGGTPRPIEMHAHDPTRSDLTLVF
jgi:Conserved oligomeric complex COG6